jgi:hypothetical protein
MYFNIACLLDVFYPAKLLRCGRFLSIVQYIETYRNVRKLLLYIYYVLLLKKCSDFNLLFACLSSLENYNNSLTLGPFAIAKKYLCRTLEREVYFI